MSGKSIFLIAFFVLFGAVLFFLFPKGEEEVAVRDFLNQDFEDYDEEWAEVNTLKRNLVFDKSFYYYVDKSEDKLLIFGPDVRTGDRSYLVIDEYKLTDEKVVLKLSWKSKWFGGELKNERKSSVIFFRDFDLEDQKISITIEGEKGEKFIPYLNEDKKSNKKGLCVFFGC